MPRNPQTVMALSAHHDRIAFCFLIDRQPMDWQMAHVAAKSPELTTKKVAQWLEFYAPDIVITEDLNGSVRKGRKAQRLIVAMKNAALATNAQHIETPRTQPFANKYEQIDQLCAQYPQMQAVAPKKRRIYEKEPPAITIFECLSMAKSVFD